MSQRHRTGDSDSHAIDARSGLTRRQWLTRAAGAAAGVGLGTSRRPRRRVPRSRRARPSAAAR